jgi:hypothetical protein
VIDHKGTDPTRQTTAMIAAAVVPQQSPNVFAAKLAEKLNEQTSVLSQQNTGDFHFKSPK